MQLIAERLGVQCLNWLGRGGIGGAVYGLINFGASIIEITIFEMWTLDLFLQLSQGGTVVTGAGGWGLASRRLASWRLV